MKTYQPTHLLWICLFSVICSAPIHASQTNTGEEDILSTFAMTFPRSVLVNAQTLQIPFQFAGKLITVEARVNAHSGAFILDTGAQRLLLNQQYFKGRSGQDGPVTIGNTGPVASVSRIKVDRLHWGQLMLRNVRAHVLDLSHLEQKKNIRLLGIIGFDVLQDFEVLLDYPSQQLLLTRLDETGFRLDPNAIGETPYDSLDFKLHRHMILLEGKVQDVKLRLMLDSGAEVNLLDRRLRRKVFAAFQETKRKRIVGVGKNTLDALAGNLYGLQLGQQHEKEMHTLLLNLTEMSNGFNIQLDGVIGYEFLASRRTLINYKRKRLYFFHQPKP